MSWTRKTCQDGQIQVDTATWSLHQNLLAREFLQVGNQPLAVTAVINNVHPTARQAKLTDSAHATKSNAMKGTYTKILKSLKLWKATHAVTRHEASQDLNSLY